MDKICKIEDKKVFHSAVKHNIFSIKIFLIKNKKIVIKILSFLIFITRFFII